MTIGEAIQAKLSGRPHTLTHRHRPDGCSIRRCAWAYATAKMSSYIWRSIDLSFKLGDDHEETIRARLRKSRWHAQVTRLRQIVDADEAISFG